MNELILTDRQTKLFEFVKEQHGSQLRKYTNEPYWTHLFSVAQIVSEFVKDELAVEIALCHDLFEDTSCDGDGLFDKLVELRYGNQEYLTVINGVNDLTDLYTSKSYPKLNRKSRKEKEAFRLGSISPLAQSVKLADLIDNTSTIVPYDRHFAKIYLAEMLDILNRMRNGNINLFIKCCWTYYEAVNQLNYIPNDIFKKLAIQG